MTTRCVVAVDVGNSSIKLAIESGDQILDHAVSHVESDWPSRVTQWAQANSATEEVDWVIASVRSSTANQLIQHLQNVTSHRSQRVTRADVPMQVITDTPDELGIDRLLAAFAATQMAQPPLVVVDAGSAMTVDWVDDQHRFAGGAILPGLYLQAAALHHHTEALPHVGPQLHESFVIPGKNTVEAIRGGIIAGAAAAVDALINRYRRAAGLNAPCSVVLTGGQAPLIAPHLEQKHVLQPNLVCRGLLKLPRSRQVASN